MNPRPEQRRGNLKPTVLPIATVAIDGKNVGTLRWGDLCRALGLEPEKATVAKVRRKLGKRYPEAQLCEPAQGEPYALVRVHTVTLISADAAPCIHQRPIEGDTNEVGAMPRLIDELCEAYRRTKLFRLVTTEARKAGWTGRMHASSSGSSGSSRTRRQARWRAPVTATTSRACPRKSSVYAPRWTSPGLTGAARTAPTGARTPGAENERPLAWSRDPHGVLAVSLLQRMALAILAVVRQLSRVGYSQERPTWSQVIGHFLLVLCDSILDTTAFDEV